MSYELTVPMPAEPVDLLRELEYAAKLDTLQFGADRESLVNTYGVCWMIAKAYLRMDSWPAAGTPVTVRTYHRGVVRGVCYRDYDIFSEGAQMGEAVQLWVTVDVQKRTIVRADKIPVLTRGFGSKTMLLGKLTPPELIAVPPVMADRHDDNGHVNNVDYVRLAMGALGLRLTDFHCVQADYHRECFANTNLPCMLYKGEAGAFLRLQTPEGLTAFDMELK